VATGISVSAAISAAMRVVAMGGDVSRGVVKSALALQRREVGRADETVRNVVQMHAHDLAAA
jgi:hypothetical protein